EVGLDLSDYAGEKVYIAFNVVTSDNQNDGWYIDDVQVVSDSMKTNVTDVVYDEAAELNTDEGSVASLLQSVTVPNTEQAASADKKAENEAFNEGTMPVEANVEVQETGLKTVTD